jgi:predicted nucleic acid-binding protein
MTLLVDTSVLIDVLRGVSDAAAVLRAAVATGRPHASEITRLEVLAGMRTGEEDRTRRLLDILDWHPVDDEIAERAGELGRAWLPGNRGIDAADLAIAATATAIHAELLTLNVTHFPMFEGLRPPY